MPAPVGSNPRLLHLLHWQAEFFTTSATWEALIICLKSPTCWGMNIRWKDWCWSWSFNTLATWYEEPAHEGEDPEAGKDWAQEEGTTENEMVGWHHWLNELEFAQTPGDGERWGSLHAAVHGVAKSRTWLNDWTITRAKVSLQFWWKSLCY